MGIVYRCWCRAEKECKALESELRAQRDLAILGMHGRGPPASNRVIVRPASAAAVVNSKSTARASSNFFGDSNWK